MVSWARDDAKLERVRALMAERELDALVVRAPDNVLYLTNFWGMKGYDACVFPREGEPVLICLEASAEDADAHRLDEGRALRPRLRRRRPAPADRAHARRSRSRRHGRTSRVGLELSLGTQATDRMVGEPTTFTKAWFDAWPDAADATPLLAAARAIKTEQEIERIRLANEICAAAMEHVRGRAAAGDEGEPGGGALAGLRPRRGHGLARARSSSRSASRSSGRGPGIKTFTATGDRPVTADEPTLFEIWVCADGYWADHTKLLCPGELRADYRELEARLLEVYGRAIEHCRPGASLAELDRLVRDGLAAVGYPGQPSHPVCHGVGARARAAVRAPGRRRRDRRGDGARDRARRLLGRRRRPARRGQLPDHERGRGEALLVPGRGGACREST